MTCATTCARGDRARHATTTATATVALTSTMFFFDSFKFVSSVRLNTMLNTMTAPSSYVSVLYDHDDGSVKRYTGRIVRRHKACVCRVDFGTEYGDQSLQYVTLYPGTMGKLWWPMDVEVIDGLAIVSSEHPVVSSVPRGMWSTALKRPTQPPMRPPGGSTRRPLIQM